jgi:hypothetical protein
MSTDPHQATESEETGVDEGAAPPLPAGDDVRIGPEDSDEPQAGAAEPTD